MKINLCMHIKESLHIYKCVNPIIGESGNACVNILNMKVLHAKYKRSMYISEYKKLH